MVVTMELQKWFLTLADETVKAKNQTIINNSTSLLNVLQNGTNIGPNRDGHIPVQEFQTGKSTKYIVESFGVLTLISLIESKTIFTLEQNKDKETCSLGTFQTVEKWQYSQETK